MRQFSKLSIIVSHDFPDGEDGDATIEVNNGHSSIQVSNFATALSMLPFGSRVQVVARGTVGNKTVHKLNNIIRNGNVLVDLDLSDVTECSRVQNSPFEGNSNLLVMRFPKNLIAINPRAFAGCTALEAISVPATCMTIGAEAFLGCNKLVSLAFANTDGWLYDAPDGSAQSVVNLHDAAENPALFIDARGAYASCKLYKAGAKLL